MLVYWRVYPFGNGSSPQSSSGADLCVDREAYLIGGGQCICVEAFGIGVLGWLPTAEFLGDSGDV